MTMEQQRLILHIGCFKTGTTSIQHWLSNGKEWTAGSTRFYAVRSFAGKHCCSTWLAPIVKPGGAHLKKVHQCSSTEEHLEKARARLRQAEREARENKGKVAIISNEHLFFLGPRAIVRLRKVLEGLYGDHSEFTIVAYVRRQDRLFQSMYTTAMRGGRQMSRDEFLDNDRLPVQRFAFFDRTLSAWQEGFPRSRLVVRSFDRDKLKNGDVVSDFANVIGLPSPTEDAVPRRLNPELAPPQLEILRSFNRCNDPHGDEPSRKAHRIFVAALESQSALTAKTHPHGSPKVMKKYAESNQLLAEKFFGGMPPFEEIDLEELGADGSDSAAGVVAHRASLLPVALDASAIALRRMATERLEARRRAEILKILLLLHAGHAKKARANIMRIRKQQHAFHAEELSTLLSATADNYGIELTQEQWTLIRAALSDSDAELLRS